MECYKEFKVRMDYVKCQKYKTFQPELPTKKFMFSDEKESIHNLKLLCDDSNELNKATGFHGEEEIVDDEILEEEQQPEEVEEVRKAMTGMFRDKIRRIDLVLVVEDDVNEFINNIKIDFLTYIVRAGLEVEIEPGVMKIHENLTFIKIHAPDSVLEKYGKFFGTKRYFADTRYDYMNQTMKYDKEWVMLVRKNYGTPYGYSNYERSIIVYKILLHLSFGDNANYYGIERLLNRKIILDVFALHDGPYFLTPDQTISGSNARQILNYYWSRIQNVFHQQPIHLIHEYFGPSLAFYFAFYEFFIKALKVAAFVGILHIILGTLNLTIWEKGIKKSICDESQNVCWSCNMACPKRIGKDYCLSIQIHLILDHLSLPLFSLFTVVGAFIFVRLWQRREFFLKWIWEVGRHDSYYKNAVRPLFDSGFGLKEIPFTGGLKYNSSLIPIIFRNVISKIIIILYWCTILPLMFILHLRFRKFLYAMWNPREHVTKKYRDYIILSMFQTLYIVMMTVFEQIYHYVIYFIVKCENNWSYKKFSNSIYIKKIGFKMFYQYIYIAYYAWMHDTKPIYGLCSTDPVSPYSTILYVMNNILDIECEYCAYCFPYTCIIEVATLLATLLIVTQVVYKMLDYIFYLRTDYKQSEYGNSDIPCWESEYRLSSWTEEDMVLKYVNLVTQFTLVTWFVIAFPLGPLILYITNVWNLRYEARKLVLASRRPLLIKTPGTRITHVFYFIAFVAILTNAINIARITRTGLRYLMNEVKKKPEQLFKFFYDFFSDVKCYGPGILSNDPIFVNFHEYRNIRFYQSNTFFLYIYKYYLFILFMFTTGCVILVIHYIIPRQQEVEIVRGKEEKIRNIYFHYEYEQKH